MDNYENVEYFFRVLTTVASIVIAIVLAIINHTTGKKQRALHKKVRDYVSSNTTAEGSQQSRMLTLSLKVLVFTNSKKILEAFTQSNNESDINHDTIIEVVLYKKIIRDTKAYLILALSFLVILFSHLFFQVEIYYALIPILFILLLYINQLLISYRIKKGWYGNNAYEALEILKYVNDYKDKDDFFDGDGMKKIFPRPIKETVEISSLSGDIVSVK